MKPRLNSLAWMPSMTSWGNQAPSLWGSMVVAASCCEDVFQLHGLGDESGLRQRWTEQSTENLLQSAQDLRLGQRFTFQQDYDPKHTAKTKQEWLRDKSLNVLVWPSQSPDLNLIKHLWRDLKTAAQQHSPSNLTALERICRKQWEKLPIYRCAKLVSS